MKKTAFPPRELLSSHVVKTLGRVFSSHRLSRSGISLMAKRTWVLRSRPAYTTPKVPLPRTTLSPCSSYS